VLLDEWSEIPLDLQPLLAEFLRRALLPVPEITVKIGAIEQRSQFRAKADDGSEIGIELGADAAADLNLDDYMVFGHDPARAREFFNDLLFRHLEAHLDNDTLSGPRELQRALFTGRPASDELVRAAEGVPRDAINIAMAAARKAGSSKIGVPEVRRAAREWFLRDKERALSERAKSLLHWIIDRVIGQRRARAFLLRQDFITDPLIVELYDARVLHVIKRGVSARDEPGVRYDVYQLDYGCYVELITTAREPGGLFEVENEDGHAGYVEVPADDYRSIRRAILDLHEFTTQQSEVVTQVPDADVGGDA
jgi:hypothetical protein